MSAAADPTGSGDACTRAAAALAPRACPGGGLTLSPSGVAALADLFRALGRGRDAGDVADRAARRVLAALEREATTATTATTAPTAPAPRTPGDQATGGLLAAR